MGFTSAAERDARRPSYRTIALGMWLLPGIGTVVNGWHAGEQALRPGTTVSGQVIAALVAYVAVGAVVGGLFLLTLAVTGRRRTGRTPDRRPRPVVNPAVDALAVAVILGGWTFFRAFDLVLVTTGETVTVSLATRLLGAGLGFVLVVGGVESAYDARRRGRNAEQVPAPR